MNMQQQQHFQNQLKDQIKIANFCHNLISDQISLLNQMQSKQTTSCVSENHYNQIEDSINKIYQNLLIAKQFNLEQKLKIKRYQNHEAGSNNEVDVIDNEDQQQVNSLLKKMERFELKTGLFIPKIFKVNCVSKKRFHIIPKLMNKDLIYLKHIYDKLKDKSIFHKLLGINVLTGQNIIKKISKNELNFSAKQSKGEIYFSNSDSKNSKLEEKDENNYNSFSLK